MNHRELDLRLECVCMHVTCKRSNQKHVNCTVHTVMKENAEYYPGFVAETVFDKSSTHPTFDTIDSSLLNLVTGFLLNFSFVSRNLSASGFNAFDVYTASTSKTKNKENKTKTSEKKSNSSKGVH